MKKGISLIVLVITIIVIIILAGAVILSLSANNPITQATTARNSSNLNEVQSAVTLYLAKLMAVNGGAASMTATTFALTAITINSVVVDTGITPADLGMTAFPTGTWSIDTNGKVSVTGQ
jgi:flagellar basal body-associated protein FliL